VCPAEDGIHGHGAGHSHKNQAEQDEHLLVSLSFNQLQLRKCL
jgi:hypothetical protein